MTIKDLIFQLESLMGSAGEDAEVIVDMFVNDSWLQNPVKTVYEVTQNPTQPELVGKVLIEARP